MSKSDSAEQAVAAFFHASRAQRKRKPNPVAVAMLARIEKQKREAK